MAVTAYTGPPGSGKSYALVSQVIVPAVQRGRVVRSNIAGLDPEAVYEYCEAKLGTPLDRLGRIELFHGADALKEGFWPSETVPDTDTVVKAGDLVVFDEWAMHIGKRKLPPGCNLEEWMRWHRHLVDGNGVASDLVIGTQLITDVHTSYRGLIDGSHKFKNLKTVGLSKAYLVLVFEGSGQAKNSEINKFKGVYKQDIFPLYKSYDVEGDATEERTDKRASIYSRSLFVMVGLGAVVMLAGLYFLYAFFFMNEQAAIPDDQATATAQPSASVAAPGAAAPPPPQKFRIVGYYVGDLGVRVVVSDDNGTTRALPPDQFRFEGDRPIAGFVDGQQVVAEDRVPVAAEVDRSSAIPQQAQSYPGLEISQ